jgi:UDP-glucose 6-dehydrogenase
MRIAVIGSGYVGLVTGTCLAESGNDVVCVDVDEAKITALQEGRSPIYEPGLEELVQRNEKEKRLRFSTDVAAAVARAKVVFVAVGTPEGEDGDVELADVVHAAEETADAVRHEKTNERQKRQILRLAMRHYDGLAGRTFAAWGLAFKPRTDDMREAPAVEVIEGLIGKGARVRAYDPVAMERARRHFGERVALAPGRTRPSRARRGCSW